MDFAHDTEPSLQMYAELVNTDHGGVDRLRTLDQLREFLRRHEFTGWSSAEAADVAAVQSVRTDLAAVWAAPSTLDRVHIVNRMLADTPQQPRLTRHGRLDWHLHFIDDDAPISERVRTELAMALVDLIRSGSTDRLKVCAGQDCSRVLIDLSRNRSRRFCTEGNCGNRTHVAAYRVRQAEADRNGSTAD
jgi:predicted RNA-binding Zn ribbon-like protein